MCLVHAARGLSAFYPADFDLLIQVSGTSSLWTQCGESYWKWLICCSYFSEEIRTIEHQKVWEPSFLQLIHPLLFQRSPVSLTPEETAADVWEGAQEIWLSLTNFWRKDPSHCPQELPAHLGNPQGNPCNCTGAAGALCVSAWPSTVQTCVSFMRIPHKKQSLASICAPLLSL